MARSSSSKRSQKDASDLDSEDEVCDELSSLRKENEELVDLLDNHDNILREAKKLRNELRALLEDARTRVAELETQVLDGKLEIDSLKASPVVSDEVDCVDCSIFLVDLTALRENHASKCEELDVLRVELTELHSRPTLLGACTSCPSLHEKIVELRSRIVSLKADLKVSIPTSCSTCELHAMKNLELAQCVDHLQDENNKLREVLSWLSSQEPQHVMMIASCKLFNGWALGLDKVGERSGERERKFGNVSAPPHPTPKDKFVSKPNHVLNPREKLSEKPCGKPSEKPCQEPHPKPKPRSIHFHCECCGKNCHKREFCYKRRREARMAKKWANKDRYHPSHGVPEPHMPLPKGKGVVYTFRAWRDRRASGGGKSTGQGPPARPIWITSQTDAR
jgi:predicted  nucleic acid-binding Zn-ribbon protein